MKRILITGGECLSGTIHISGAKNSAVALLPAAILTEETVIIDNIPNIADIAAIEEILIFLGARVKIQGHTCIIDSKHIENKTIPEELAKKLRASYYFMGALCGRFKECILPLPGGCPIGERPMNLHLTGLELLGCQITNKENQYHVTAQKLVGTLIDVSYSVGATINVLFASVLAEGKTTLLHAAKEPEIGNVVDLLNAMGANIVGRDTDTLVITGVERLHHARITTIPDRIEAGTYLIAGALCGKNLTLEGVVPEHVSKLTDQLKAMEIPIEIRENYICVSNTDNMLPCDIVTKVYPGFPTDLQQPMAPLCIKANGESSITETIYENRFKHVSYLNEMGADIKVIDRTLKINGPKKLHGCLVSATDLRAGASLILAGLIAEGTTVIQNVEHILRGYEGIVEKLEKVGAKIKIEEI